MSVQLKKGVLEMCVLSSLSYKDMYGYEIYQSLDDELSISESTIYPILRKLVKEDLCETYLRESNEGPPRKYFSLTSKGVKTCKDMLVYWEEFVDKVNSIIVKGGETK